MARRSAPLNSGPAYIPQSQSQRRTLADPNESAFARFLRTEIFAPEKIGGNISLVTGVGIIDEIQNTPHQVYSRSAPPRLHDCIIIKRFAMALPISCDSFLVQ
ncbi:hypothetical protein HMN09_00746600 [Mycena chlorophos]|uniref:Uncharacterized protein n=1 Tax=Mycena chlorophos TaxID=658473 RepID=A0A8H6W4Y1_MYCCL|nr:hypothetical protein HMN09_00746600 [Mycena chlorophos]